jgi:cystathionine beta-lyase/cystathionine gamma-synthase
MLPEDPLRRRAPLGLSSPLVPPLYQSAVYTLPDLDALDQIMDQDKPGFIYARDAHPNSSDLSCQLADLEGSEWAVICGSGMAAISGLALSQLNQGDRLVASNRLYGRTTQLFMQELARFGVRCELVDCNDHEAVRTALVQPTRILFVETMSNPMLRVVDIAALAEITLQHNCLLVVDNTFATPVLTQPIRLGADLVMESLTKMIGGHSDITLGAVCGTGDLFAGLSTLVSVWGFAPNPFDCWLAQRGLATLALRVRTASASALALAEWLVANPRVARVIYPGLPDHTDHALARRVLDGGFGHMLCFELAGGREAVNRFLRRAPGIPLSPSLGHTFTTVSHPASTSHRYVSPAEKRRQGISEGLIRMSVGVEDLKQIQEEIARGLA